MDQRAVERQSTAFVASCCSFGRSADCRLLNISAQGCLIEVAEPILREGNRIRIKISGISSLNGEVMWHEGTQAGVSFAATLHPAVVAYIAGCLEADLAEFPPLTPAG